MQDYQPERMFDMPATTLHLRRILLLFLVTLLPCTALAQRFAGNQCEDPSQGLLWRVQAPAAAANAIELHLFGSIHVGKADFYPLTPRIEELFRGADNLVFEVNPDIASDPAMAMRMQLRGILPAGQTLDTVVSAETLRNLDEVMRSMGLPMANFMNFKPWMIALLLTNLQASAQGFDPAHGLESYLLGQRSSHTQVLELESIQAQLDLLESLDPEAFLGYTLEEFSKSADLMNQMIDAWLCGDKTTLTGIVFAAEAALADDPQASAAIEEIYDLLFAKRNIIMANGIEHFFTSGSGSYFVVVGSGHLLGEGSVVELLEQRGYRLQAVSPRP
jgi:uncharacterized protein